MEYTIDQMAEAAVQRYQLSRETALQYVNLGVGAIKVHPALWNADNNTATAEGFHVVVGRQMETEMSADPGGYDAELRRAMEKWRAAQQALKAAEAYRDQTIRLVFKRRRVERLMKITGFSRARIYQIRDER